MTIYPSEYHVMESLPVCAERFQIRDLQLENIVYDKITIPSLGLTLKLGGLDADKWLPNPNCIIALIASHGKTVWFPASPENYASDIAYQYLHRLFGERMISYTVTNTKVKYVHVPRQRPLPERFNRLHRATITLEGRVVYYLENKK
jgi:hypothetical protein